MKSNLEMYWQEGLRRGRALALPGIIKRCLLGLQTACGKGGRFLSLFRSAAWHELLLDQDCYGGIPLARERLLDGSRAIEAGFMRLGTTLEKLPDASEALLKHSRQLIAIASGQDPGAESYRGTIQMLSEPLAFLDQTQGQMEMIKSQVESAIQKIDRLIGAEERLTRALTPLTYLQRLFKIECSTLQPSVQQMFKSLTDEIQRMEVQVTETFAEKFAAMHQTRKALRNVSLLIANAAQSQGVLIQAKRHDIEQALGMLDHELRRDGARNVELAKRSQDINEQVGRLVMCVQTQDIVSQKLSHVAQALDLVQQRRDALMAAASIEESSEGLAYCCTSFRLQCAHLVSVEEELTRADSEVHDASKTILQQLTCVDTDCLSLRDLDSITASADGIVEVLLRTMEEVRTLIHGSITTNEQVFNAILPLGELTSNLTPVVRRISSQIHLIALNAQIQAAHEGLGTGLEVLAAGTAEISLQTRQISEDVASGVDQLSGELMELVHAFQALLREGKTKAENLDMATKQHERVLHTIRDRAFTELKEIGIQVSQISKLGEAMESEKGVQQVASIGLQSVRNILEKASDKTTAYLDKVRKPVARAQFADELARPYSVASEHQVHRTFFGQSSAAPAPSAASDLEMFLSDTPATGGPAVSELSPTVLSFDDKTSRHSASGTLLPASPLPANPPEKSLGDNVDLF